MAEKMSTFGQEFLDELFEEVVDEEEDDWVVDHVENDTEPANIRKRESVKARQPEKLKLRIIDLACLFNYLSQCSESLFNCSFNIGSTLIHQVISNLFKSERY